MILLFFCVCSKSRKYDWLFLKIRNSYWSYKRENTLETASQIATVCRRCELIAKLELECLVKGQRDLRQGS